MIPQLQRFAKRIAHACISTLQQVFIGCTINTMQIEFDTAKKVKTLAERGLDFARAGEVFASRHLSTADDRFAYGEQRFITLGWLDDRLIVLAWTPRGEVRRIISMRKANEREQTKYASSLG